MISYKSRMRVIIRAASNFRYGHRSVKYLNRCYSGSVNDSGSVCITKIPLSEPVSWLPRPVYAEPSELQHKTEVTTLSNGLRVATEAKFGNFCTVGVVIDSGSRYEVAYPSGISHILEKLSFGETQNMTREEIMQTFEKLGGICDCQCSRDTFIYAASVEATRVNDAIKILGEVTLRPKISDQELNKAHAAVRYDLEDLQLQPEKDAILMEMIHASAYRDNTVGLPKICPQENITKIDHGILFTYLKNHYNPSRIVLAGVGVDHDKVVDAAQRYFVEEPAIWVSNPNLIIRDIDVDTSVAQYTGGMIKTEADLSDISVGPNPLPDLAHLVIGMESVGHQHKDFVTFCLLNMMMGGGGSFSAGGPGKGMYTRLYTNVLNRYHWMHNATAYNHAYGDTGLFCIHASAHPSHLADLTRVITREFSSMVGLISEEELKRAKKQLQSMLLMNLESRPVIFEDIGRQVLATGKRHQPDYFIRKIEEITAEDIIQVASKMLRTKPSVAALGSLARLPTLEDIQTALLHRDGMLPNRSRFSIFR